MNNIADTNSHQELLEAIFEILKENGLTATTMDVVAKKLKMSKRTLYEIFESKTDMITRVFNHNRDVMQQRFHKIMQEAPNVMVALMRIFAIHRDNISGTDIRFYRDLDELYPGFREQHQRNNDQYRQGTMELFKLGVEQGVFREDVNYDILSKIISCHSEALKRSQKLFPDGLSILEVYDTMTAGFLRSIASPKGYEMLNTIRAEKTEAIDSVL